MIIAVSISVIEIYGSGIDVSEVQAFRVSEGALSLYQDLSFLGNIDVVPLWSRHYIGEAP